MMVKIICFFTSLLHELAKEMSVRCDRLGYSCLLLYSQLLVIDDGGGVGLWAQVHAQGPKISGR